MTEWVVDGIGDEERKPEAEPTEALAGAEAFGTAVVARLPRNVRAWLQSGVNGSGR
jgi:hypothetical protein